MLLFSGFHHSYTRLHLGHKGLKLVKVLVIHLVFSEHKVFLKWEIESLTLSEGDLHVAAGILLSRLKERMDVRIINTYELSFSFPTFDLFDANGATGDPDKDMRTSLGSLARLVTVLAIEFTSNLGVIIGVIIPAPIPTAPTWLAGVSGTRGCPLLDLPFAGVSKFVASISPFVLDLEEDLPTVPETIVASADWFLFLEEALTADDGTFSLAVRPLFFAVFIADLSWLT